MITATSLPHSLGPVSRWLGIKRSDRYKTEATWATPGRAIQGYVARNITNQPEGSALDAFRNNNDGALTMLQTAKGVLVKIRVDFVSPRPHNMARHELQGTKASYTMQEPGRKSLIWIEDRSATSQSGVAEAWEPISKYYEEFEHPLWREHRAEAEAAGHGGGDFFVLREFVASIREERPPVIDVYDAVTWSCITPLSMQSIDNNNAALAIPNFKASRS
jgi:hypothetical protein